MGGWFRKEDRTRSSDFKGLRMRIPNLGGKVIRAAGGTTVLTPAGDIYAALERGVIDVAEWVGPHDDMLLGLHKTARYYYYPGWHEPGTDDRSSSSTRRRTRACRSTCGSMLDHAAAAVQVYGLCGLSTLKNAVALERLKTEFKGRVEILQFPVAGAARSQKARRPRSSRKNRRRPRWPARVHASYHEVPGAGRPVGSRGRGRLPPACRGVTGSHMVSLAP